MAKLKPFTQHKPCPMKQSPSLPEVLTDASYKAFFYHSYTPLLFSPADKMQHPHITHCEAMDFGPHSIVVVYNHSTPSCNPGTHPQIHSCLGARRRLQLLGTEAGKVMAEKEMARTDSGTNIQTNFF